MRYTQVRELIQTSVDIHQPAAVICTGVSSRSPEVCVERVAVNIGSAEQGPNFGFESLDQVLNSKGPAAYFSTLPIRDIVQAINDNGIPARISNSAGTQGCNLVFYHLMDYLAKKKLEIPAGFIHLPRLPENAIGTNNPSMSLENSTRALEIAVSLIASRI